MTRPKLEVNEVWILQEIFPYEGSTILDVFYDIEVAKKARPDVKHWHPVPLAPDSLSSVPNIGQSFEAFYYISKHTIRTK